MQSTPLVLILLFCFAARVAAFRQQSVGIRGRLMCGERPLSDTTVKLWNKNHLGTDDQLADMKTDAQGNYQLEGGIGAIFAMDVHLRSITTATTELRLAVSAKGELAHPRRICDSKWPSVAVVRRRRDEHAIQVPGRGTQLH
ncbi:hypothetical protein L596_023602 [Steinernema carpocapsae]|uniref:Transthyretin/hydroxyisourate hydrolase domain-containing protein n=1 Tax=Steinernema carpocapsae TaxID=34508 RepID=A0A4U5MED5_STECR|nr:hypothetical protein L596_023602 [Steinernema carpocapsae]